MRIFTSWVTNWLDPERPPVRLMLFALMLAGLVLSTSIPQAFGNGGLVSRAPASSCRSGALLPGNLMLKRTTAGVPARAEAAARRKLTVRARAHYWRKPAELYAIAKAVHTPASTFLAQDKGEP